MPIKPGDTVSVHYVGTLNDGSEFDPLSMGEPDVEAPMEVRGMGGLGIYLVRRNVDDIVYSREDGRNVLTLVKDLS